MGANDLRVTVEHSRLRCVFDPALVLCHALGPRLAMRLTRVFEPWLTRSFWQVIDSSELLLHHAWRSGEAPADHALLPDPEALAEWIALRDRTDAGSWLLRWVGDCLAESQLATPADNDLIEHYERLAAAVACRLVDEGGPRPAWRAGFDPVVGALDAVALSASLEGALILSAQPDVGAPPWAVQALGRLGVSTCRLEAFDGCSLFEAERQLVRQALAGAGLAPLLQGLPPLAVVHAMAEPVFEPLPSDEPEGASCDPWRQARAWWYLV